MRKVGHGAKQRLTLVVDHVFLGLQSIPRSVVMGAAWLARGLSSQLLRRPSIEKELLNPREPVQIHTGPDSGTATADRDVAGGR